MRIGGRARRKKQPLDRESPIQVVCEPDSSIGRRIFHAGDCADSSPARAPQCAHLDDFRIDTVRDRASHPLLLLLGIGAANAADPAQLVATGGFLLGNAHRCGVAVERVERAGSEYRNCLFDNPV
jgi:hypothetical protein